MPRPRTNPSLRFSDTQLKKIPFSDSKEKQVKYKDIEQKGLYLVVSKTRKVFRLISHIQSLGKPVDIQIGPFPDLTTEMARKEAIRLLSEFASGQDPRKNKTISEEENKTKALTLRGVLADYVKEGVLYKRLRETTASRKYGYDFDMYAKELLDMKLHEITKDVLENHFAKEAKKPGKRGNGRLTSLSIFIRSLSAVLTFAEEKYGTPARPLFPEGNPVKRIKKVISAPKKARERVLSTFELPIFFEFIYERSALVLGNDSLVTCDYLLFLLFTGARRREAAVLTWKDVEDLDGKSPSVIFRDTKTHDDRKIPIGPFLTRLLKKLKERNSEFVFPSHGKSGHVEEPKNFVNIFISKTPNFPRFSVHDIRRTFITHNRTEVSDILYLKVIVGHTTKTDTTSRHYSVIKEEVSPVLRETMNRIEESLFKKCQTAKIV